jgi:glucose-6-phosphate 1-dehydrogenase
VEAAWAIVSPLNELWRKWNDEGGADADMCFYEAGSWGPSNADDMIEHDGRRWRRL